MRLLLSLVALLPVAACNRAQSFDERYGEQSAHISATANGIERQVAAEMSGAAEANRAAAEMESRSPAPGNSAAAP